MNTNDPKARKVTPLVSGCYDYFPDALAAVARLSLAANEQHNPGEPMHWARGKSDDHVEALGRHLQDRGTLDTDGQRHSAKVAWRALAALQLELEREEGCPVPRGAKVTAPPTDASAPPGGRDLVPEDRCEGCRATRSGGSKREPK